MHRWRQLLRMIEAVRLIKLNNNLNGVEIVQLHESKPVMLARG